MEAFAENSFDAAPFAVLSRIAGRRRGLLRTVELREAGLNSAAVTRWVAAKKLHRKYPGVYAFGHKDLSRDGEFLAAVFAVGEGAVLGHEALAEL